MTAIKHSIKFVVEAHRPSTTALGVDAGRLRCVVTWNNQRVRLNLFDGVVIDRWDAVTQRCKARTTHGRMKVPAMTINRDIDRTEDIVEGIFDRFAQTDSIPTKDELITAYNVATGKVETNSDETPDADKPLMPFYDDFVSEGTLSGRWSKGTLVKTKTIRKHLTEMGENLTLNQLIDNGVVGLVKYFSSVPDNYNDEGLSNTTAKGNIAFIKIFLRWAQEKGYCDASPILNQRVKLKTADRPVIFLTWDELMRVYHYDFGRKNYLSMVRDVFCFCCFTSLRYSDVYNLRRSNIVDDEIRVTTIKTHDFLAIELNEYSRAILKKYENVAFANDKALPVISNQKMNEYLKEMGQICGLDSSITITKYKGAERIDETFSKYQLLSTHCGRRTFISNAIMMGIPANVVMRWTGHSDYEAMKPYIAIADKTKKTAMALFDQKIKESRRKP